MFKCYFTSCSYMFVKFNNCNLHLATHREREYREYIHHNLFTSIIQKKFNRLINEKYFENFQGIWQFVNSQMTLTPFKI